MELRREKSKLSCKRRQSTDLFNDELTNPISQAGASTRSTSTPVRANNPSEDEDSPYFPCSTQEMNEDVDVLWDWNSPQSKPKTSIKRKSKKRLNLQHSPKIPFRRHPSNNNEQIKQDFNKLREELRALKAEIAKPDDEESLVLSPREEEVFKKENERHLHNIDDEFEHSMMEEQRLEVYEDDVQDPFDDDMDDQLILFSQQIESKIEDVGDVKNLKIANSSTKVSNQFDVMLQRNRTTSTNLLKNKKHFSFKNLPTNNSDAISHLNCPSVMHPFKIGSPIHKEQVKTLHDSEIFNDSFDNVLSQMIDDDLDQLTQVVDIKQYKSGNDDCNVDKKSKVFPRSLSHDLIHSEPVQAATGRKVEWHRTQSFESYDAQLSREKLQEIERKRLEAKAKRDAKKKHETIVPITSEISDSPLKCSPDEIEKKRLQALEKLEAKRLQDIIEKKKQEALKRREESRKKNASQVKSSLTTRL